MSESIIVLSARTEDLDAPTRASIIHVCIAAHQKDDFNQLFTYIPAGGIHVLAYRARRLETRPGMAECRAGGTC